MPLLKPLTSGIQVTTETIQQNAVKRNFQDTTETSWQDVAERNQWDTSVMSWDAARAIPRTRISVEGTVAKILQSV